MAFKIKEIIDLKGLLLLMFLIIPSQATNLDCNNKAFYCVNSTHFMICVDLGTGISTTIDEVVIPCPSPTICKRTNRYECEFPVPALLEPEVSTIANAPTTVSEVTTYFSLVTSSIPFEEHFNTPRTTTVSESEVKSFVTDSSLSDIPNIGISNVSSPKIESENKKSETRNISIVNSVEPNSTKPNKEENNVSSNLNVLLPFDKTTLANNQESTTIMNVLETEVADLPVTNLEYVTPTEIFKAVTEQTVTTKNIFTKNVQQPSLSPTAPGVSNITETITDALSAEPENTVTTENFVTNYFNQLVVNATAPDTTNTIDSQFVTTEKGPTTDFTNILETGTDTDFTSSVTDATMNKEKIKTKEFQQPLLDVPTTSITSDNNNVKFTITNLFTTEVRQPSIIETAVTTKKIFVKDLQQNTINEETSHNTSTIENQTVSSNKIATDFYSIMENFTETDLTNVVTELTTTSEIVFTAKQKPTMDTSVSNIVSANYNLAVTTDKIFPTNVQEPTVNTNIIISTFTEKPNTIYNFSTPSASDIAAASTDIEPNLTGTIEEVLTDLDLSLVKEIGSDVSSATNKQTKAIHEYNIKYFGESLVNGTAAYVTGSAIEDILTTQESVTKQLDDALVNSTSMDISNKQTVFTELLSTNDLLKPSVTETADIYINLMEKINKTDESFTKEIQISAMNISETDIDSNFNNEISTEKVVMKNIRGDIINITTTDTTSMATKNIATTENNLIIDFTNILGNEEETNSTIEVTKPITTTEKLITSSLKQPSADVSATNIQEIVINNVKSTIKKPSTMEVQKPLVTELATEASSVVSESTISIKEMFTTDFQKISQNEKPPNINSTSNNQTVSTEQFLATDRLKTLENVTETDLTIVVTESNISSEHVFTEVQRPSISNNKNDIYNKVVTTEKIFTMDKIPDASTVKAVVTAIPISHTNYTNNIIAFPKPSLNASATKIAKTELENTEFIKDETKNVLQSLVNKIETETISVLNEQTVTMDEEDTQDFREPAVIKEAASITSGVIEDTLSTLELVTKKLDEPLVNSTLMAIITEAISTNDRQKYSATETADTTGNLKKKTNSTNFFFTKDIRVPSMNARATGITSNINNESIIKKELITRVWNGTVNSLKIDKKSTVNENIVSSEKKDISELWQPLIDITPTNITTSINNEKNIQGLSGNVTPPIIARNVTKQTATTKIFTTNIEKPLTGTNILEDVLIVEETNKTVELIQDVKNVLHSSRLLNNIEFSTVGFTKNELKTTDLQGTVMKDKFRTHEVKSSIFNSYNRSFDNLTSSNIVSTETIISGVPENINDVLFFKNATTTPYFIPSPKSMVTAGPFIEDNSDTNPTSTKTEIVVDNMGSLTNGDVVPSAQVYDLFNDSAIINNKINKLNTIMISHHPKTATKNDKQLTNTNGQDSSTDLSKLDSDDNQMGIAVSIDVDSSTLTTETPSSIQKTEPNTVSEPKNIIFGNNLGNFTNTEVIPPIPNMTIKNDTQNNAKTINYDLNNLQENTTDDRPIMIETVLSAYYKPSDTSIKVNISESHGKTEYEISKVSNFVKVNDYSTNTPYLFEQITKLENAIDDKKIIEDLDSLKNTFSQKEKDAQNGKSLTSPSSITKTDVRESTLSTLNFTNQMQDNRATTKDDSYFAKSDAPMETISMSSTTTRIVTDSSYVDNSALREYRNYDIPSDLNKVIVITDEIITEVKTPTPIFDTNSDFLSMMSNSDLVSSKSPKSDMIADKDFNKKSKNTISSIPKYTTSSVESASFKVQTTIPINEMNANESKQNDNSLTISTKSNSFPRLDTKSSEKIQMVANTYEHSRKSQIGDQNNDNLSYTAQVIEDTTVKLKDGSKPPSFTPKEIVNSNLTVSKILLTNTAKSNSTIKIDLITFIDELSLSGPKTPSSFLEQEQQALEASQAPITNGSFSSKHQDLMQTTDLLTKDFSNTSEDILVRKNDMTTEERLQIVVAKHNNEQQNEISIKGVKLNVTINKPDKRSLNINSEVSIAPIVQSPIEKIGENAQQIDSQPTPSITFSDLRFVTESIKRSEISPDKNMKNEPINSGIISFLISPPTQRVTKEKKEITDEIENEVKEKPEHSDTTSETLNEKIILTHPKYISTPLKNVDGEVQDGDSTKLEMRVKNDYNLKHKVTVEKFFVTTPNLDKNGDKSTTTAGSKIKNKISTQHESNGNSTATTNNSHTSNNKSKDQNKSTLHVHNMTVISHDQGITSRYMSNINTTAADDTPTTGFPALEPTTRKTNPSTFLCAQKKRGRYADERDCRKFYICLGNEHVIEGMCPVKTVFSETRKQCTKNLSQCIRNNQFRCVAEGHFSDILNDNVYYICVKKNESSFIRFKLLCQNGYHLNKTAVRCVLNDDSNQSSSKSTNSESSKNNSDQSVSSTKTEEKEKSEEKKFRCKKDGIFADPSNCKKYFVCTKSDTTAYRQKRKKCDSGEIFHKDKKKCVDSDSYEC